MVKRRKEITLNGKVARLADDKDIHPASRSQCDCGKTLTGTVVELIDPKDIDREDSYVVEVMCCECFARNLLSVEPHA